jgi:hypothetical protein
MVARKQDVSNPRLFNFSMVTEDRLEELLIITIFAPLLASFSTETTIVTPHSDSTLQHTECKLNSRSYTAHSVCQRTCQNSPRVRFFPIVENAELVQEPCLPDKFSFKLMVLGSSKWHECAAQAVSFCFSTCGNGMQSMEEPTSPIVSDWEWDLSTVFEIRRSKSGNPKRYCHHDDSQDGNLK